MIHSKNQFYYNAVIQHDDTMSVVGNTYANTTPLYINQTLSNPILSHDSSNYIMSIIKADIPTSSIPLQIFATVPDPADPLNMNYSPHAVTLQYLNNIVTYHLEWITQDATATVPSLNSNRADYDPYYSCYSIKYFLSLVNTALKKAYDDIQAFLPIELKNQPTPFFVFESPTQLIVCNYPTSMVSLNKTTPYIKLFFEVSLFNQFVYFPVIRYPYYNNDLRHYEFILDGRFELTAGTPDNAVYSTKQEIVATRLLLSPQSIIITSNTLPAMIETFIDNSSTFPSFDKVICEFSIPSDGFQALGSNLTYIPQAEYRRISLIQGSLINTLQLSVLWVDNYGRKHPCVLRGHEYSIIKLLFERV